MKLMFRLFLASFFFVAGYWLFAQIQPASVALAVGILAALAEVFEPVIAGRSGAGGGLRLFARLGATLIAWPLFALALEFAGMADRPLRIAVAAAAASAAGVLAAGHGSGRDTVRLWAVIAAAAVPLDALLQALLAQPLDHLAIAAGAGAVAVSLLVARQSIVWPQEHSKLLLLCAGACGCAGLLSALPALV
ncbi:MAG: hypothetical protein ACYCST_17825 [Acidimicrobiales bacterium]